MFGGAGVSVIAVTFFWHRVESVLVDNVTEVLHSVPEELAPGLMQSEAVLL